jgi:hypothetical protein
MGGRGAAKSPKRIWNRNPAAALLCASGCPVRYAPAPSTPRIGCPLTSSPNHLGLLRPQGAAFCVARCLAPRPGYQGPLHTGSQRGCPSRSFPDLPFSFVVFSTERLGCQGRSGMERQEPMNSERIEENWTEYPGKLREKQATLIDFEKAPESSKRTERRYRSPPRAPAFRLEKRMERSDSLARGTPASVARNGAPVVSPRQARQSEASGPCALCAGDQHHARDCRVRDHLLSVFLRRRISLSRARHRSRPRSARRRAIRWRCGSEPSFSRRWTTWRA